MHRVAQKLQSFIALQLGIQLSDQRLQTLLSIKIEPWLEKETYDIETLLQVLETLPITAPLYQDFIRMISVQESYFFRSEKQLKALTSFLEQKIGRRPLRIWCAGCSHGAEVYSLAYSLQRANIPYSILGTDILEESLATARNMGPYGRFSVRNPRVLQGDLLYQEDDAFWVNPKYKSHISFENHNILAAHHPTLHSEWDIIICRNVFIYFSSQTVNLILQRFHDALSCEGTIWLGINDMHLEMPSFLQRGLWSAQLFYYTTQNKQQYKQISSEKQDTLKEPSYPYSLSSVISQINPLTDQDRFGQLRHCIQRQLWQSTIQILTELEQEFPQDQVLLLTQGAIYAQNHQFFLANEIYFELTQKYPDFAEPHYLYGLLAYKQKKWPLAKNMFTVVINLNRSFWPAYIYLGLLHLKSNQYLMAEVYFEQGKSLLSTNNHHLIFQALSVPKGFHEDATQSLIFVNNQLENSI